MRPVLVVLFSLFASFSALPLALAAPAASSSVAVVIPGAPAAPAVTVAAAEEAAPDSPRASMSKFRELCREGRWEDAAGYLDVPKAEQARAPMLARRLKAVLDRRLWLDPHELSPSSKGDPDDGLPWMTDELGKIRDRSASPFPVRISRRELKGEQRWVFTQATVQHVDEWFDLLEDRWIQARLPEVLLRPGPRDVLWWQWIAIPILIALSYGVGRLLSLLVRLVFSRLAKRTTSTWDDDLLAKLGGPINLACALGVFYLLTPELALYAPAEKFVSSLLRALFFIVIFWALMRAVGTLGQFAGSSSWAKTRPGTASLLPLLSRAGKLAIFILASIAVLSELGYQVTSLIAGLGIGGVAIALAAQKTVENLFGSLSISIDQPFRTGDSILVDGITGTVEFIGLRSTRIRTAERTLVTIPNGKLADMKIESLSARDRMRFAATVSLSRDSTEEQVRAVIGGIESALRAEEKLWAEGATVKVKALGEFLDIDVGAWFSVDADAFLGIRERLLLSILAIVKDAGTSFAAPPSTVHVGSVPAPPLAAPKS